MTELARRIATGLAVAWCCVIAIAFVLRILFPLELEWMEGGVLHQALRLQTRELIYPEPSFDFVPFLYTPLYSLVLAGVGFVFPLDYATGRAISWLASVAICWALWRAIGYAGKPRAHQAVAVGLFLSGYVFTFRWLDVARPDALHLALVAWALVLLRESRERRKLALIAGLLMAAAFWTKQTAAGFVLVSGIGALLVAPRQLWIYALTIAVVDGGGVLIADWSTEGWLWTYIYDLHQAHAFNRERFTTKTWGMFAHAAPFMVALLLGLLGRAIARWRRGGAGRPDPGQRAGRIGTLYWGLMAVAGLVVSALSYSTQWAEPNAFLPGVCFGALFVAHVLPAGGRAETVSLGFVSLQLLFSLFVEPRYQPIQDRGLGGLASSYALHDRARTVPSSDQRQRASELRTSIEQAGGEVFALHRPWWNVLAGGSGHIGSMNLHDIPNKDQNRIMKLAREAIASGRFEAIWIEGEPPKWIRSALSGKYHLNRRLRGDARVRPMTGYMSEAGMVTPYRRDQIELRRNAPRTPPEGGWAVADFESSTTEGFRTEGGFGSRPVRGFHGPLPPVGPHGGDRLLSSAGSRGALEGQGVATSGVFKLPEVGRLEVLVGTSGPDALVRVEVLEEEGQARTLELDHPRTNFTLEPLRWEVPADWSGARVRLRVIDDDPEGAIFFDDLWVVPAG